jgi:hypothetical protein
VANVSPHTPAHSAASPPLLLTPDLSAARVKVACATEGGGVAVAAAHEAGRLADARTIRRSPGRAAVLPEDRPAARAGRARRSRAASLDSLENASTVANSPDVPAPSDVRAPSNVLLPSNLLSPSTLLSPSNLAPEPCDSALSPAPDAAPLNANDRRRRDTDAVLGLNGERLAPRFVNSPDGGLSRDVDFTMVYDVQRLPESEDLPNGGSDPALDLMVEFVNHFMQACYYMFLQMLQTGECVHAAAGHEQGEENERPHGQIAGRFRTRRTAKYFMEYLRYRLHQCIKRDERTALYRHYVSVVTRKKQTQEFNLGYTQKQDDRDLFNQPGVVGNWTIGMNDEFRREILDVYWSHASKEGTISHQKAMGGSGGRFSSRNHVGGRKLLDVNKSNFVGLGDSNVKTDKLGVAARRACTVKKVGWLLERGRHTLATSWASVHTKGPLDEAQLQAMQILNDNPLRAADLRLVRKAMTGQYDRARSLIGEEVTWAPHVFVSQDVIDMLSLSEIRHYALTSTLPPFARLMQDFPWQQAPAGHAIIVDLNYKLPQSTSEIVARSVGVLNFNCTFRLHADAGEAFCDEYGGCSVGVASALINDFGDVSLDKLQKQHMYQFASDEWEMFSKEVMQKAHSDTSDSAGAVPTINHHLFMNTINKRPNQLQQHFLGRWDAELFATVLPKWLRACDRNGKTWFALIFCRPPPPAPEAGVPVVPDVAPPQPETPGLASLDEVQRQMDDADVSAPPAAAPPAVAPPSTSRAARVRRDTGAPPAPDVRPPTPQMHHFLVAFRTGPHPFIGQMNAYSQEDYAQYAWGGRLGDTMLRARSSAAANRSSFGEFDPNAADEFAAARHVPEEGWEDDEPGGGNGIEDECDGDKSSSVGDADATVDS